MAFELNDIELRLQNLIEVHLVKYLPGPNYRDRISRQLAETLRSNLSTKGLKENANVLPHMIQLVVNPAMMSQWQKDPRLMEGLTKIYRLVASEIGVRFDGILSISLVGDPLVEVDDVRVQKANKVAETQDMREESHQDPPGRAAFLIVGGTRVFPLNQAVTNIGRRLDNHLVVDDPRVSRYHAQIRYVRGRFILFDLNSTGGTYINGQRVNQSVLYPGDVISLAGLPIVFGQDNPPPSIHTGDTAPFSQAAGERQTAVLKSTETDDEQT
jgi:pSer/pThr/pTyr-binding forkhead associated (FHA) protein